MRVPLPLRRLLLAQLPPHRQLRSPRDVIHQQRARGPPVVRPRDGAERLLAGLRARGAGGGREGRGRARMGSRPPAGGARRRPPHCPTRRRAPPPRSGSACCRHLRSYCLKQTLLLTTPLAPHSRCAASPHARAQQRECRAQRRLGRAPSPPAASAAALPSYRHGPIAARTVSQICSLICFWSMLIMRAPNSTPMVRSCTGWKRLSVNCSSRHDLPTPAWV